MFAIRLRNPLSASSSLTMLALFAALNGCGPGSGHGAPEAYLDGQGKLWAFGSVQLADLDGPGTLVLNRNAADQSVDTSWTLTGTLPSGEQKDLAYVDLHPSLDRVLAYAYTLNVQPSQSSGSYDVFALLRLAGRTHQPRQRVYLGSAALGSASSGVVSLAEGLHLSLIADGVFAGQWAMHYPAIQRISIKPWQGMCPVTSTDYPGQSPGQRPGQNPGQNPGQYDVCRPLPPEKDLCNGDPTQAACRPLPPTPQPSTGGAGEAPAQAVRGAAELEDQGQGVYVMPAEVTEAKLTIVSATLVADSDEANAELCSRKFSAVARTVGDRVNHACVLTPAPAVAIEGKLACGLTVRFDNAQTYLEKVCDVTVVFKDGDVHKAQILKR